jgi:hypothetical protein
MSKVVSKTIKWTASTSPDVVGYKLYFSTGTVIDYASSFKDVGNKTSEVVPADVPDFPIYDGNIMVGISAYDEVGNESDIAVVTSPFDFVAPDAPTNLAVV